MDPISRSILDSAKYRSLHAGLVEWVVAREAAKGRSAGETEKAARSKLHQVVTAYLPERPQVQRWLASLAAAQGNAAAVRDGCRSILAHHASSRERLPLLDRLYAPLLAELRGPPAADGLPTPLTVLDLACGLHPLALPWMGLPSGARLLACDVHTDLTDFLAAALPLLTPTTGAHGEAFAWNLLEGAPPRRADVALLLKTLPCLEQLDASLPRRLLESVHAPILIVSFPVRSLGGRAKGMPAAYAGRFEALMETLGWRADVVWQEQELVYRVQRPPPDHAPAATEAATQQQQAQKNATLRD